MSSRNTTSTIYAAVGSDGSRLVVWGIGETEDIARDDGERWMLEGWDEPSNTHLDIMPITSGAALLVRSGHVALEGGRRGIEICDGVIEVRS